MDDVAEGDVSIIMDQSDDKKTVTLVFQSNIEIDTNTFILSLESYLTDIMRAAYQREQAPQTH